MRSIGGPDQTKYATMIYLEAWPTNTRRDVPNFENFLQFLKEGGISLNDLPEEDGFYVWKSAGKNVRAAGEKFNWPEFISKDGRHIPPGNIFEQTNYYYKDVYVDSSNGYHSSRGQPVMFRCQGLAGGFHYESNKSEPSVNCETLIDFNDGSAVVSISQNLQTDVPKSEWIKFYQTTQKYIDSLEGGHKGPM